MNQSLSYLHSSILYISVLQTAFNAVTYAVPACLSHLCSSHAFKSLARVWSLLWTMQCFDWREVLLWTGNFWKTGLLSFLRFFRFTSCISWSAGYHIHGLALRNTLENAGEIHFLPCSSFLLRSFCVFLHWPKVSFIRNYPWVNLVCRKIDGCWANSPSQIKTCCPPTRLTLSMELRLLPASPMLRSCHKASKKVSAVALKRVCPAPSQPDSRQKKQPFCHVPVMVLVVFLSFSGDSLFQSCCGSTSTSVVVCSEAVLLWAQRAEGSSVCPWPRASQRRESNFLLFVLFYCVSVTVRSSLLHNDSFDSESTALLGAMSANQSLICKVQMVHWQ